MYSSVRVRNLIRRGLVKLPRLPIPINYFNKRNEKCQLMGLNWTNIFRISGVAILFCMAILSRQTQTDTPKDSDFIPLRPNGDPVQTKKVVLSIGVPTVTRPLRKYLRKTLTNLIQLAGPFRGSVIIQVLVADLDRHKRNETLIQLQNQFSEDIASGLLRIATVELDFYASRLTDTDETAPAKACGGNSSTSCRYVKWRNKQNLDYAQLIQIGATSGQYYVQLEDDIECGSKLFPDLFAAVAKRPQYPWIVAEISSSGFIGKMFPSDKAVLLSKYLLEHYYEKACDWLYPDFLKTQPTPCIEVPPAGTELTDIQPKRCDESFKSLILYGQNEVTCRHLGRVSSLPGKLWS